MSTGKITIACGIDNGFSFYDEITTEKIDLPLIDYEGVVQLSYLTKEQAAEYFTPKPPEEKPQQPTPGDDSNGEDTPPEQPQPPQGPGDQTGDNDTTGGEQPPQEPTQPPKGEGKGDPTDNPDSGDQNTPQQPDQPSQDGNEDDPTETPPQPPEQPKQPPQGDSTDNPAATIPSTPQQPQEPPQSGNANDDDYAPPTDYRPSQRPMWPATSTSKPTEPPQLQPDVSAEKPQLICNGAVIDTSRTIVLFGYGDGQLHEADSLTRAQLATIIYRLLDDETIARYSGIRSIFVDIAADSWYAPYINVIGAG